MTIVTKPLTDEKKDLKPLVVVDAEVGNQLGANAPVDGQDGGSTISDISVYKHPYRRHRTGFLVCLGLLIILTIGCATMGGIYLYYRLSQPEGYRGSCTIRFNNQQQQSRDGFASSSRFGSDDTFQQLPRFPPVQMESFNANRQKGLPSNRIPDSQMHFPTDPDSSASIDDDLTSGIQRLIDSFQQDFELDLQKQLWEIFQVPRVPQLGLGRPARFIHDFSLNLTAILDTESRECYVMPLNRSVIKPPRDLFDFLQGLQDGIYNVDGTSLRQTYFVDPLPVLDYAPLGPFITRECVNSPTYWLVKRDSDEETVGDRVRRAAGGEKTAGLQFSEFAGSLHTVNILKNK